MYIAGIERKEFRKEFVERIFWKNPSSNPEKGVRDFCLPH